MQLFKGILPGLLGKLKDFSALCSFVKSFFQQNHFIFPPLLPSTPTPISHPLEVTLNCFEHLRSCRASNSSSKVWKCKGAAKAVFAVVSAIGAGCEWQYSGSLPCQTSRAALMNNKYSWTFPTHSLRTSCHYKPFFVFSVVVMYHLAWLDVISEKVTKVAVTFLPRLPITRSHPMPPLL